MDPRNHYTESSSYFPFNSNVHLGESENPPFSSHQSEDTPVGTPLGTPVGTPVDRVARRKWTPADDEVLISAWLNTSKDAVVGNQQKSLTFWQRVADYYTASPHGAEEVEKREHLHCKKRWARINDQVNKFCGAYATAERQISSGESDTDVLKRAHDIFYADQRTKFNLEYAWCVLRYEQKWLSLNTPKASSKRKNGETPPETPPTENADHETRPEGIKAAKSKRNTGQGKSVAEYTTLWEMKKEDLAMKERLTKLAILDTLLQKSEPLTEAEEVVKNKLLAAYF
ncbi:glutathione S-transferase T3-like [Brassica napus]|uniref:glutathione S-transferase T3-like n=1 Tax=Brassica napus TaxID=3708 RepID=UPI0006AB6766|nr:glutathione S-transferase T3-like [Brassica napus]